MEQTVSAKIKLIRISARKLRLVADVVRGKNAAHSLEQLQFLPKKGSNIVAKVLKSAMANAEHNFKMKKELLMVKEVRVDEGPTYKRYRAASKGRGREILKRTSSINIILVQKQ